VPRRAFSSSSSVLKDMTSEPTMGAQEPSVITLRTSGRSLPCSVTMLAIWITGSFSASGKQPCRRAGGALASGSPAARVPKPARPRFS